MALLWMDGFDHYGAGAPGRAAMLDGVWAQVGSSYALSTVNPRTGATHMRVGNSVETDILRRVLGGAKTSAAVAMAAYFSQLPAAANSYSLFSFRDAANTVNINIILQPTGVIEVHRGWSLGGPFDSLGVTPSPVIVAGAYQHLEVRATFSNTVGAVEVRVNGVTVLSITGADTVAGLAECSQVTFCWGLTSSGNGGVTTDFDDVFAWDALGTENNDFLGDRRVRTLFPDANTAVAGWTPTGAATGYECIDDSAPDDEATYVSAAPLTGSPPTQLVSEFGVQDPPAGVGAIAAVQTYVRMRKTEAGVTDVMVSMLSGTGVSDGQDRAITEAYTYWTDVHELNPNTGTPWSESSLSGAKIRITRTA